jgi:uncharacterized membrane protein
MAHSRSKTRPNILTRCLAAAALVFVYCIGLVGTSAVMLAAGTTTADARGGGRGGGGRGGGFRGGGFRGGGFRGGGYRGGGWGRGRGFGFGPRCFYNRWGRLVCPYY